MQHLSSLTPGFAWRHFLGLKSLLISVATGSYYGCVDWHAQGNFPWEHIPGPTALFCMWFFARYHYITQTTTRWTWIGNTNQILTPTQSGFYCALYPHRPLIQLVSMMTLFVYSSRFSGCWRDNCRRRWQLTVRFTESYPSQETAERFYGWYCALESYLRQHHRTPDDIYCHLIVFLKEESWSRNLTSPSMSDGAAFRDDASGRLFTVSIDHDPVRSHVHPLVF